MNTNSTITTVYCSCGKEGDAVKLCELCHPKIPKITTGWICPQCNRSVNPDLDVCPCYQPKTSTTFEIKND